MRPSCTCYFKEEVFDLCVGITGGRLKGWVNITLRRLCGGFGIWVGSVIAADLCWERGYLDWVGDIRGRRVEPSFRNSWSYLVFCITFLFVWSLGSYNEFPICSFLNCYEWSPSDDLGSSCMWGVHTSLGVIRKARLGEMLFCWSPYLLWIPKSKPISQLYWPTNLLLLYLYTWGILGILGWDRLYWIYSWQLVIYFGNCTYVDKTMMYLDLDFLFRLGAKNYIHQPWDISNMEDKKRPAPYS
ncbi:hypothetical protein Hanom_Chr13g01189211 [Helianthus anomalus]